MHAISKYEMRFPNHSQFVHVHWILFNIITRVYMNQNGLIRSDSINPMGSEKLHDLMGGPKRPPQISETTIRIKKFQRHWKELFKMHQIQSR